MFIAWLKFISYYILHSVAINGNNDLFVLGVVSLGKIYINIIALYIADTSVFLEILVYFLNNLPKKTDSSGHQMNFGKIN